MEYTKGDWAMIETRYPIALSRHELEILIREVNISHFEGASRKVALDLVSRLEAEWEKIDE